jgi:nickel-dependent lactate racemase
MLVGIDYGRRHVDLKVEDSASVGFQQTPPSPPIVDLAAAVSSALESPIGFPALNRALTPDDNVVIVLDEQLPRLPEMLVPVLEHIVRARVRPDRITILMQSGREFADQANGMPPPFKDVHTEVHDPANRRKLSYLATTRRGRRVYLNRTAVDADQVVVLARRRFDPLLGYSGAEGALYPTLSDEATRQDLYSHMSLAAPGSKPWPARKEATEVAWLLGVPFVLEIIEGTGDELAHVIGGTMEVGDEGIQRLDANWRISVDSLADLVVAAISGDADRQTFADLAGALATAARVVKPQGRIVLVSDAAPSLGAGSELLRQAGDPDHALKLLRDNPPSDMRAAYQWASAAKRARLFVMSRLPADVVEQMFATPLEDINQLQRLVASPGSRLFLPDAHKMLALATRAGED